MNEKLPQEMLDFIRSQRIGVISVALTDGSPHGATVHFAHVEDPFAFIILTDRNYKKSEPMLVQEMTKASFVIGTDESLMKEVQLDGTAHFTSQPELIEVYASKFPEKVGTYDDPDDVFFVFMPIWWRYTDWKKPEGKTVFTSDGAAAVEE